MQEREAVISHIQTKIAALHKRAKTDMGDTEARCAQLFEALKGEIEQGLHLDVDSA